MLAASIADGLHAVIALVRSNSQGRASTIVRCKIEALGDLYHLGDDRRYLFHGASTERAAFASELAGIVFLHLLDPLVRAEEGVLRHVG